MEISPQTIRSTGFRTVKKGYDPEEVESFRSQVADVVETAQNQATAMEARARAAVAKLQEVSQAAASGPREAAPVASSGDTEVISRTLLLAQRTADAAVLQARTEADEITSHAREEASRVLDSARTMASSTVEEARVEARRAVEDERVKAENEVQSLLARRDFLLGDVDHLEQYLQVQRDRLRDAAVQLQELAERVPGGLGDMRRPLLSASAEPLAARGDADEVHGDTGGVDDAGHDVERVDSGDANHGDSAGGETDQSEPDSTLAEEPEPADVASAQFPLDGFDDQEGRDDAAGVSMFATNSNAHDNVWRLLDEEVASTRAAQHGLPRSDGAADAAPVSLLPEATDPFGIGGSELR